MREGAADLAAQVFSFNPAGVPAGESDPGVSLAAQLGDRRSAPLALSIAWDGLQPVTITLDQDYRAMSNAAIVLHLNTRLAAAMGGSAGGRAFSLSTPHDGRPPVRQPDRESRGINAGGNSILRGMALAWAGRDVRIMTSTDPLTAFAGIAINDAIPGRPARWLKPGAWLGQAQLRFDGNPALEVGAQFQVSASVPGALVAGTDRPLLMVRSVEPHGASMEIVDASALVPALDAATTLARNALTANDDGSFNLVDLAGNIGLRFDAANGLQTYLAQFTRLVATSAAASKFESPGAFTLSATDDGALLVTDLDGNIALRLDGTALTIANLAVRGALALSGGMSAASYSLSGCTLSTYADPNVAFCISDTAGWVLMALLTDGTLLVPKIQTTTVGTGGDYSDDYIAERSNRAVALAAGYRGLLDTTSAAAVYAYNHVLWYGQSLCAAQEGWPAKTLLVLLDVLMIGQSTRPGGANTATSPSPAGDSVLRPAVATVQNINTGALLDAAAQAALPAGDGSLGEDPGVAGMQLARRLFLQRLGVASAPDRLFVTSNVGVSGRSIEELSKGAATEYFNRLRVMATAVKNAATAAGGSYGVSALFWMQGEWNYSGSNGGSTDKATYKTNLKKLYDDFVADICVGIAGQAEKPAIITYQTGGSFTVDSTDMSIGMAQFELSQENPSWYLATPSYPATDKGGHLDPNGYRWIGLQMCKVFHEVVVMRRRWKPLHMTQATVRGKTVLVDFFLPSGTPLQFKPVYVQSVPTTYTDKGFTLIDDSGTIPLVSVTLAGDAVVKILMARAPVGTVNVYYGRRTTHVGGGNLCDSDPTISPFPRQYAAGSGDYATANLTDPTMPFQVGQPDPLWNWAIAQKIAATAN